MQAGDKSYLELLTRKKYLNKEIKFNSKNQELSETTYNYLGEIEDFTIWKYDKNVITISYNSNTFGVKNLTIRKLDDKARIISENLDNKLTKFKYQNDKLIEKNIFENNKLISTTSYIYTNNQLTSEIYDDIENSIKSTDKFDYNEKGYLKTKTLDRRDGIEKYQYEYIYW